MAYTNAVFYVDDGLDSGSPGSDATRSTLSGVVFDNSTGTTVRGTYTAHGLVTGAVIDVNGTTNGNGAYKITVLNANTFTLDATLWASFTGADVTGDVVPRGGSSWADAWATPKLGATALRTQAGDTIRVAKSPAPASIGDATWTDGSQTVTLASALTLLVDDCESGWTAANSSTVTHSGSAKSGSFSVQVTKASYATATKYAYKTISSLDLSVYERITFWMRTSTAIADANRWVIKLCSDTTGDTPVDEFPLPAFSQASYFRCEAMARTGGGTLGSAIQSIAIYSGSSAPDNNNALIIDNVNACNDFSLLSLITKNSTEASAGTEALYCLNAINGTTLTLDGSGYTGVTETVETFVREGIPAATALFETTLEGLTFTGGWDVATSLQDGVTVYDGVGPIINANGLSVIHDDTVLIGFSAARCYTGLLVKASRCSADLADLSSCTSGVLLNAQSVPTNVQSNAIYVERITASYASFDGCENVIEVGSITGSGWAFSFTTNGAYRNTAKFTTCTRATAIAAFYLSAYDNAVIGGSADQLDFVGVQQWPAAGNTIENVAVTNYGSLVDSAASVLNKGDDLAFIDCTFDVAPTVTMNSLVGSDGSVRIHNLDGYHYVYKRGGTIYSLGTDRSGSAGPMWRLEPESIRTSDYPLRLPLAKIAVDAGKLVTVTAWMNKSHATNVTGRLVCRRATIVAQAAVAKTDATGWELVELTFTPSAAGVIEIEAWAEYVAGLASVDVESMTITQAD